MQDLFSSVVDCGKDNTIILGKPWIVQHQCQLNFATGCNLFSLAHQKFNLPMGNDTPSFSPQPLPKPKANTSKPLP